LKPALPKPSAMEIIAMVSLILPSVRILVSSATKASTCCALVPSSQKPLGQRFASSGARSVTALRASCG